jgi:hypothetical protein
MTSVDLHTVSDNEDGVLDALIWMIENQGPIGPKRRLSDLRWLEFEDEKEATFFILKWSKR